MNKEKSTRITVSGINFASLLFLMFLFLKLGQFGEVANWSWWWVTAPLWLPIVAVAITLLIIGIIAVIVKLIND
jgi:hypothetical protein